MLNVITAKFCSGSTQTWTDEAYQYDYGQVLQFDGLTLPDAYEVHFSNTPMSGETITQIGGSDGVTVPDQFFLSGSAVYAWIYLHEGEDDGETVYMVTIPVKKRPQPSDDVPTPVEQSAIDQAIAALNVAVDKAEDAIEHYPRIQDGTWWVWDVTTETWVDTDVQAQGQPGTDGTDGDDGFSPVITVTDITGGHRVTITDAEGTQTVDVLNGQPGTPGYSPTVTVTEITGGHRVTITDKTGQHTFDVMDGSDASVTVDDELSNTSENPVQNKVITGAIKTKADLTDLAPSYDATATYAVGDYVTYNGDIYRCTTPITTAEAWTAAHWTQVAIGAELTRYNEDITELSGSIAPVESSTTATAAHAVGELFLVGETLMVALSAIAVGDTITTEGSTPNAAVTKLTDKLLKDVQVNGTSIVTDGVADVPIAGYGTLGVMSTNADYGISAYGASGRAIINKATDNQVQSGSGGYRPVVPDNQHRATFYGLAKAASDTTQSASSNPVGTYTETAQSKISDMLNAPVTVSGTTPTITAMSGVRYICGEVATLSITPPASGCCDIVFDSGSTPTVLTVPSTVKWANSFDPTALEANTTYEINIMDGLGVAMSWT